jgi:ABC-type nitrate/sulfonate/bicarbonate transport system substrate-binding protein
LTDTLSAESRVNPMRIRLAENFRAVFYAPFYATQALGFYAREGVDVELIASSGPGDGVAALLDGTVDITWGGPMRVMKAREQQQPHRSSALAKSLHATPSIWSAEAVDASASLQTYRA